MAQELDGRSIAGCLIVLPTHYPQSAVTLPQILNMSQQQSSFDWRMIKAVSLGNVALVGGALIASSTVLWGVMQQRSQAELPSTAPVTASLPSPSPTSPNLATSTPELQTVPASVAPQQYSIPTAGYQEIVFPVPVGCIPGSYGKLVCFLK